ncbi:electron transfer flavoprotein subunit alpha/FixB family protein [Modestobacter sp. SSW1-42]|uniref:electron transfer flavoprotein subunit alpha/FixB family protein n=1 Tax=Modestobacter sp. SSW1-42 TaxID=596372 RepID=UPI00398700A4
MPSSEAAGVPEVLVLAGLTGDGEPTRATLEALTAVRVLGEPVAVVLGAPGTAAAVAERLARYGARRVLAGESPALDAHLVGPRVGVLARLVADRSPAAVVVPAGAEGREVAARLAVRTGSGFLTDVVGLAADGTATRSALGGTTVVQARVTTGTPVLAWRAGSLTPVPAPVPAVVEHVPVELSGAREARVTKRVVEPPGGRPALAEAPVVVAVGRGVAGAAEFAAVEELADALGAAIGASRAAVDAGFCPPSALVGQSGTRVTPRLYVAVGISGAAQHWSGVRSAHTVVAVNSDPDAPVFALADFGVVGDVATVVPELTAQITARRA